MSANDRIDLKDRMARAEDYVLGLMDEQERQRAERDMEVDAAFRDCVLELALRLQRLHEAKSPARAAPRSADETWGEIAARLSALPQMAGKPAATPARPEATAARRLDGPGLRRGLALAAALAVAFALGWLAARSM